MQIQSQPLIAVHDVEASSRWYQAVLGSASGHGGREYERIVCENRLILQLHAWDAHDHPHMGDPHVGHLGNGMLLWFEVEDFDAAMNRIRDVGAEILEGPHVNASARHREIWLRDLDGYVVVIAGRHGGLGER